MTTLGVIGNLVLIVLLVIALVSVWRLNRRILELREGRAAFEKLTAELARQTDAASGSVGALRQAAETLGKQLDVSAERGRGVIAEMQRASDDLRLLIGRGDAASGRLEGVIAQSRSAELLMGAFEKQPARSSRAPPSIGAVSGPLSRRPSRGGWPRRRRARRRPRPSSRNSPACARRNDPWRSLRSGSCPFYSAPSR